MVCYWWRHLWCTVALLTLCAGLTRVAMSSAGAVTQVEADSSDQDIIRYLQDRDDYRMKVVIECFQNRDAWKNELSRDQLREYFQDWSAQHVLAKDVAREIPPMFDEDIASGQRYRKIDVALYFLQEIHADNSYKVDEVIKALNNIKRGNGVRLQVRKPISLVPMQPRADQRTQGVFKAPETKSYTPGKFTADSFDSSSGSDSASDDDKEPKLRF